MIIINLIFWYTFLSLVVYITINLQMDGGLVVETAGRYETNGGAWDGPVNWLSQTAWGPPNWGWALLIVTVLLLLCWLNWFPHREEGLENPPGGQNRGQERSDYFRDAPIFSEMPNDVVRREDREMEAVRALAAINQERLRRTASEDVVDPNAPLQWKPFWNEWQASHPLEGEPAYNVY